jgi:hypothetical protein
MLVYVSVYVLAAVLIFQGVNLLGEQTAPTNVVPPEVRPAAVPASRWGGYLAAYGALLALVALLSHGYGWLFSALAPLRNLGFASMAVYGLWLVFGAKVNYSPARAAAGEAHGHH